MSDDSAGSNDITGSGGSSGSSDPFGFADDQLRDRLQALDPAVSLPPVDPAGTARLLEDTMTDQRIRTPGDESRIDHTHGRSPLTWLVAAAAAVLIGGGVFLVLGQDDDSGPGSAGSDPALTSAPTSATTTDTTTDTATDTATDTETVTQLTSSGAGSTQKCMVPEAAPEVVASQTTVFDGVVESISSGVVTLRPTHFFAGDATDLVTVEAPSDDMQALLTAVKFEEGGRYLVAATDSRVTVCGFSAAYSDSLAQVYETAFAG